jgi:adenylate cyclase
MSDLNSYRIFSFQSNKDMKFFGWKINEDTLYDDIVNSFIETFDMSIDEKYDHFLVEGNVNVFFDYDDDDKGFNSGTVTLLNPDDNDDVIYHHDFQIIEVSND